MQRTEVCEHEVSLADPIWDSVAGELDHQPSASLHSLMHVALDESSIRNGCRQASERDGVHVVRGADFAHHLHLRRASGEHTNSQSSKSVGLGKCSGHEQIRKAVGRSQHSLAAKFVVRLIDQHRRLRRCVGNLQQILAADENSSRIIGACYRYQTGLRTDSGKNLVDRKTKAVLRIGLNANDLGPGALRVNLIHGKCGDDDDHLVRRFEISFAEKMNGFIDSICQQDLGSVQTQILCNQSFNRRSFRIFSEFLAAELL